MAKVGDRFAFRLTSREWLSGRVLLDVRAQCIKPKRVAADSELGFFGGAFLVEIYATPTARPEIRAEEILTRSMFIYPGGFKGDWEVLDNVAVDPTQVDFPPALLMRGIIPHLSWGELSLATTLTPQEADAIHVRGSVHGAGLVPAICLVELGRGAELDPVDYPNPSMLGLASSDLRISPHGAHAFAAAGLANRAPITRRRSRAASIWRGSTRPGHCSCAPIASAATRAIFSVRIARATRRATPSSS